MFNGPCAIDLYRLIKNCCLCCILTLIKYYEFYVFWFNDFVTANDFTINNCDHADILKQVKILYCRSNSLLVLLF